MHDEVVGRSELYPLNSLDVARHHLREAGERVELRHEQHLQVGNPRLFFGNGTQLQEMYITPAC